jgi:hypothetical protein
MSDIAPEDVQRHYNAAMDSVNLLNKGKPLGVSEEDWADRVSRNVEHLKIMAAKDYWNGQDLSPLLNAIATHDV